MYMPTTNKRINLTVPEELYTRLMVYKRKNGITSDAAACLQLIVRQLDGLDKADQMLGMVSKLTPDELLAISRLGIGEIKRLTETTEE